MYFSVLYALSSQQVVLLVASFFCCFAAQAVHILHGALECEHFTIRHTYVQQTNATQRSIGSAFNLTELPFLFQSCDSPGEHALRG